MTPERQRRIGRAVAIACSAVIVVCAVILAADYVAARRSAEGDAARVASLQAKAQTDPSVARAVNAEQDRITRARQARKARGRALGIVLIASSAAFVGGTKWRLALGRRRPVAPVLVRLQIRPGTPADVPPALRPAAPAPAPPAIDLTPVDGFVTAHGRSTEAAIPILQAIQAHYRYLPDEALRRVCELTDITPAQIAGTSSFYARFRRSPVGDHVVRVCHGTACHVSGARQITEELRRHLGIPDGADTDPARRFTIDEVACLGCCSLAPVLVVDEHTTGRLTPAAAVIALCAVDGREQLA